MKSSPGFLAIGFALVASTLRAAPLPADSTITAVTVYADRAVVTRSATLDLNGPGPVEVAFERLPAGLVEQSLTVSGRGTAQTTIVDVAARDTHVSFTPNERAKAVEEEIKALTRQRRTLEDRVNVLKAQEASLGRLEGAATAAPTKDSAPRMSLEESLKLLAFLEEQRTKLAAERQRLDGELEALGEKQSVADRQLASLQNGPNRSYKTVIVRLEAAAAGKLELAIGYAVPGASWTPTYDVRASSSDSKLDINYFGLVRQHTGEDWKGVALTLSTARPSLGGAAPEVGIWEVDILRPRRPDPMPTSSSFGGIVALGQNKAKRAGEQELNVVSGAVFAMPDVEQSSTLAQATVETAATSASFKIAATATVASDNSPQKVPITTATLASTPEYFTTPKRLAAAFLTAHATNTSDYPLLPGNMNVFLDGTFVATSPLRAVMPGEKFELALGADEGVWVKHKRVQRFTEDTGLTNSGKRITYEYVTTLQNNKPGAARVMVSDHVPISRQERIVVKMLSPTEREQKPTNEGALKWTVDLKPGEKRDIVLKFSVDHPNDYHVVGLE